MLKVGIIGAGSISLCHIDSYVKNPDCEVVAVADLNLAQAQKVAEKYGIKNAYADYHDILNDKSIDAVSICTPTFTHKNILIETIDSGKHILCEKPPALNAQETRECVEYAKKHNKHIMYAFVIRFRNEHKYLKEYIDAGKMGKIMCAEAVRIYRCNQSGGWFIDKSKSGGGPLIDANIHEIDSALYFMGYPKPKVVMGFASDANKDLPAKIKGHNVGWVSADKNSYKRDIESVASGYVKFDNGSYLYIKTSFVLPSVVEDTYIDICGEKAAARLEPFNKGRELRMVDTEDNYLREVHPVLDETDVYQEEINHFVDCCVNGTECMCKMEDAITLMEIIDAIYKSAETGMPVIFD